MKISEMSAEELRGVLEQVQERRRVLANQTRAALSIGDTVVFTNTTKPTYLRGVRGTVMGFGNSRVNVRLAEPMGRFSRDLRVPASIISKVG